jgi:hypothetical protein
MRPTTNELDSVGMTSEGADSPVEVNIPKDPYCFVADTDSSRYLLDTGANRVILNDKGLLSGFHLAEGEVKGVGGAPALINGNGKCKLTLHFDDGTTHSVTFTPDEAV